MASMHQHPASIAPMPAVARILARFDRESLSGFIEVAIGLLDVMEPDPEAEDGEGGGNLVDHTGRFIGCEKWAAYTHEDSECSDGDLEHDGREREDGF